MKPKTLHLHVKTIYFEQIKAGTKTEEFRLFSKWKKRLFVGSCSRQFDGIVIWNAFKSGAETRLEFPFNGWRITTISHPHFGPEPVTVFAIKLQ